MTTGPGVPGALGRVADERIVDVDVRDDLRRGREPFSRIMAARERMPEGGVLRVRAIFEPVPLYGAMARHGLRHWTEERAPDDWWVWFYDPADLQGDAGPGSGSPEAPESGAAASTSARPGPEDAGAGEDVVVLDVRGLGPPEPLVRTLEALEELPSGSTLLHLNVREPVHLFPRLEERGATWEVRRPGPGLVQVLIRRPSP